MIAHSGTRFRLIFNINRETFNLFLFRKVCSKLYFRAEAQQIDRILEAFAQRYWECNPKTVFRNAGIFFLLEHALKKLSFKTQSLRYRVCCRVLSSTAKYGSSCSTRKLY